MMRSLASVTVILAACSSAGSGDPDPAAAPTLVVTSPARGTTADAGTVTVTGTATGAAIAVTVNGATAPVAADGTFTVAVPVTTGITLLETHAIDRAGHDLRDVRAVLAGTLAPSDGTAAAPLAARAGGPALAAIGRAMATAARAIDFTAEVEKANPIYDNGGCLGATVNVTSVALSDLAIAIAPGAQVLATDVEIDDLVVKAHVDYKAACLGGSTTITITASAAKIHGDLGVALAGGALTTALPSDTVTLEGFGIDVGGLPDAVVNLVKGTVQTKLQNALAQTIRDKAPGLANAQLAALVAKPLGLTLLGAPTRFDIAPARVDISPDGGLYVEMASTVAVAGGEGGMYAQTGAAASPDLLAGATTGLGLAVATDSVNALMAGLWAAGALDQHLDASAIGPLLGLLDANTAALDVAFSLPPTMAGAADGALDLALGDVILTGRDASGAAIQTVALSVATSLTAGPTEDNHLALVLGSPAVKAQVVQQRDGLDAPLADDTVEAIVGGAWGIVGSTVGGALGNMPMPSIAGVHLGAPAMTGAPGFAIADVALN